MQLKRFSFFGIFCENKKRSVVYLVMLLLLLSTCVEIIYPFIYKFFIDSVLFKQNIYNLIYVFIMIIVWLFLSLFLNYYLKKMQCKFIIDICVNLKGKLFSRFIEKDLGYYRDNSASEMNQVMEQDIKEVEDFLSNDFFVYVLNIMTSTLLIIIMCVLNPVLLVCCMMFFVVSYFETNILSKKMMENTQKYREEITKENELRIEELKHFIDIKTLGADNRILRDFENRSERLCKYIVKEKVLQYKNKYFGALNHDLITRFFVYTVGGILVINNGFSTSSFLVFLGFFERYIKSIRAITESNFMFAGRSIKLEKIIDVIANNRDDNACLLSCYEQEYVPLCCKRISFRYPNNDNYIIKDFSCRFMPGHVYLLQGESGIGKTTLINLILRDYLVNSGVILFGNNDICKLQLDDYYKEISVASADTKIFNGTIKENLLFANLDAEEKDLVLACKKSGFYTVVKKLPQQMDYLVGENGSRLSGGQKERLVLARLFLARSPIYILDEALAEISAADEIKIYNNLIASNRQAIFIIISHRIYKYSYWEKVEIR